MIKTDKHIIRGCIVLTYVLIISIVVFLLGSSFSYLHTGADRSAMLHTNIQKAKAYQPKMNWVNDGNEGRKLNAQLVANIEKDYVNAWYVRHVAYKTNQTVGIDDYYTENARKIILDFIVQNQQQHITITATTLSHTPNIEFVSEDGQLVVLTDKNVTEYKQMYQEELLVMETTETANYKVIMLLEDGFWRIRHLVKETAETVEHTQQTHAISPLNLQGINYYPQATPWNMFGDDFNLEIIKNDFEIIQNLGLNTIRIFIPYEDFGKANVKAEKLNKLRQVLNAAENKQLQVIVTLFDFYGNYEVLDWTLTQRHAEIIISTFKNHKAILAWDIKNEPNLDFKSRGKHNVLAWLSHMISLVKSIDQNHLVTIGWSNTESAHLLQNQVDFVSFHYYDAAADFSHKYANLTTKITDKPIVLGEFGQSSYGGFWKLFTGSEKKQASYFQELLEILKKEEIPYLAWTLYDFDEVPSKVVGKRPWRTHPQKKFGILDKNGERKKVFEIFIQ